MARVTRFAARDPGPAARLAGFLGHLRENGLRLGVGETATALEALSAVSAADPLEARLALKSVCASSAADWEAFDALFDAYWLNEGRVRSRVASAPKDGRSTREGRGEASGTGSAHAPDGGSGEAEADGEGRLKASRTANLMRKDLRELVSPQDIRAAEAIARRLAAAFRDRRSRRRKAARKGERIDFRRVIRQSLATGGEPLSLPRKARPDRPVKIAALCDVSGSMTAYARVHLAFLAGLLRGDETVDAWIFHTRLARITEALRDKDAMRALNRLSLIAEGFGGGSKIGSALETFARGPARSRVDGRTVVLILSDGYDTEPPDRLAAALAAIAKRGCRIVWLNPLKGWKDYAPVAGAMAAALPHLDAFAPAATLADLAALEPELSRL